LLYLSVLIRACTANLVPHLPGTDRA
jgi:hypothetical protein